MKVLLVDDHTIVRSGLRNLLTSVAGSEIFEAANGKDALIRLRADRPDLILLDLYLSKNASAEELLTAVRRVAAGERYIEAEIAQEMALRAVSPGHGLQDLTERDLEIMRLLAKGMSLAEIADTLGIGYKTVANTCSHIQAKLGVTRTGDLVRLAMTLDVG